MSSAKPYAGQRIEPERAAALKRLHQRIGVGLDDGATIPCIHDPDPDKWIDEALDAQREAAAACFDCPLMSGACESYITSWPEPTGVWAGLIPTERTKK